MSWTTEFVVSDDDMEKISNPKWVIKNLIIQGHFIVIPAPPNGGKTTIMLHLSGDMAAHNYDVYYVNADVSGSDAKSMQEQAKINGFKLMLPDFQTGLSMDDVVYNLKQMSEQDGDYSKIVFIFDTLKKMTDVINKSRSKELYKILRSLTAKGMTVICLAHTNKYKDTNDQFIYEGTADLRSDVDEMIFLVPMKNDDGSITVSTRPDKVRGTFEPMTYKISPDRKVTYTDYIDVAKQSKIDQQREKDAIGIASIQATLAHGESLTQSEIISACDDAIGKNKLVKMLKTWSAGEDPLWSCKLGANNSKCYSLIPTTAPYNP